MAGHKECRMKVRDTDITISDYMFGAISSSVISEHPNSAVSL